MDLKRLAGVILLIGLACQPGRSAGAAPVLEAVGVENEYADVIAQIGGRDVRVVGIVSDPNTDPHSFEISPKIAGEIAQARLVVMNGLGYDDWAGKIIAATPNAGRQVIVVQSLLNLPDSTANPHLWYDPGTMPTLARRIAADMSTLMPAEAAYFSANATSFIASLKPWSDAIAAFRTRFPDTPVAVTEPVADDLLAAVGADVRTPFSLQAAIMNGTDPAPQDVAWQNDLFTGHKVKALIYNAQVTDPLTASFLALARANGIPVIAAFETMPAPGYDYQTWMMAEVTALRRAITDHLSSETLPGR